MDDIIDLIGDLLEDAPPQLIAIVLVLLLLTGLVWLIGHDGPHDITMTYEPVSEVYQLRGEDVQDVTFTKVRYVSKDWFRTTQTETSDSEDMEDVLKKIGIKKNPATIILIDGQGPNTHVGKAKKLQGFDREVYELVKN